MQLIFARIFLAVGIAAMSFAAGYHFGATDTEKRFIERQAAAYAQTVKDIQNGQIDVSDVDAINQRLRDLAN